MLSKAILSGLTLLSLTACGTVSSVPEPVLRAAPTEYLEPTPVPDVPEERTNGALARYIRALQEALKAANDDKAAVLQWFKELT